MVLKVLLKFPPALALVHGWLFPVSDTPLVLVPEEDADEEDEKEEDDAMGGVA